MGETLADNQGQQFNANIGVGCHDCYCFSEGGSSVFTRGGGDDFIKTKKRSGFNLFSRLQKYLFIGSHKKTNLNEK